MTEVTDEAPGRVNLLGEHTDYHEGFVLPTVIPQRTRVRVTPHTDNRVCVSSREFPRERREYFLGGETRTGTWVDYVQGVTHVLRPIATRLSGFDIHIESAVPIGAGLSSSAALEVALLRALRQLYGLKLDDVDLARVAQRAETEFVGAPVGIMDHMVCSLGQEREALFLDTRSLDYERIALPLTAELVVIDSGISHDHAHGAYAIRRDESFAAAAMLGVSWLRDIAYDQLDRVNALPHPLAARARHIVTENQRVHDTVDSLRCGDVVRAGRLFNASHDSMRDDYETSTPEIDRLVELGKSHPHVYGARLTGGGFGGAAVMLVAAGMGNTVADHVLRGYRAGGPLQGRIVLPQ